MKSYFLILSLFCSVSSLQAQIPKSGTYTYAIAYAEWDGKSLGATCTVIINGNRIKVVHNGEAGLTGNKGDVMAEGIIMKHTRTGKWIIGQSVKDKDANEIGGCSEGPPEIDFKHRKFWLC